LARGEGGERTPLIKALADPKAARAVLIGAPGSGKTTFVNYVTYILAESEAGEPEPVLPDVMRRLLPVRLIMRHAAHQFPEDATEGTAEMLWNVLHTDIVERLGKGAAERLLPHLQERILKERCLLLDGLDEVPEAQRRRRCYPMMLAPTCWSIIWTHAPVC
jgi:predicted NACHT family NTPase